MPTERLSMRKIRDVLRLKFESGLSERVIGRAMSLSNGSVNSYLQRARMAGLGWPLPDGLDDAALERLLFPPAAAPDAAGARARPEWAALDKEMRRKGVTLALLWEEYRAAHPDGFGYSWFCEQYGAFKSRLRPSMRQSHAAGEKVFVDFAGDTIDVIDPSTGEVRPMKLFVAAMGASSYIFAQARPSEQIADWIGAHVDLLAFLGGAPKFVVCDNLKAAVTNPDRYEPGLNRSYLEFADHYGVAILPARPYRRFAKGRSMVLCARDGDRTRRRALGRHDPFAEPPVNGRYLREGDSCVDVDLTSSSCRRFGIKVAATALAISRNPYTNARPLAPLSSGGSSEARMGSGLPSDRQRI